MVEQILHDVAAADDQFAYAALRYFNVAGCAADGTLGEDHRPETHLVPLLLQAASHLGEQVTIFGTDHPTPDGTCIRDYIHVEDLVDAHVLASEALVASKPLIYNLGIGRGHSVKQVVDAAGRVTGADIRVQIGSRRAGDPPVLYANADKIRRELGWEARITNIDRIVDTAWQWLRSHQNGYGDNGSVR